MTITADEMRKARKEVEKDVQEIIEDIDSDLALIFENYQEFSAETDSLPYYHVRKEHVRRIREYYSSLGYRCVAKRSNLYKGWYEIMIGW